MSKESDMMMNQEFYGGALRDRDFFARDVDDEDSFDEDSLDEDFFGGARRRRSRSKSPSKRSSSKSKKTDDSKHTFSVAYVDTGSYSGGHFVSATATNAAKKAATAIFRHIDLESGAVKAPKTTKGETKSVAVNAQLKYLYGKKPISGVSVHFVILRKERKSLPKYYAYVAKRIKLSNPVETAKAGNRPAIKYEYKVELKADKLPARFQAENEEFKKAYNAAKRSKKAALEKKEKKVAAPKKTAAKKKTSSGKSTPKRAKKATGVELDDIIKALSNPGNKKLSPKPAKKAPKRAASPKPAKKAAAKKAPKRAASPKPAKKAPKRAASPKPAKKAAAKKMTGGSGFCSFF